MTCKSFKTEAGSTQEDTAQTESAQKPLVPWTPPRDLVEEDVFEEEPEFHGPMDYFLTLGTVGYGGKYMLVDRQILPFCNFSSMGWRKDVVYARAAYKMRCQDINQPGVLLVDEENIPKVDVFAELDEASYISYTEADGVIGFTGSRYSEVQNVPYYKAAELVNLIRFTTFITAAQGDSSNLWPSFFVRAEADHPRSVQMWDVESEEWVWVVMLEKMTPITMGTPNCLSKVMQEQIESRLDTCLHFAGPVYIGMRNSWTIKRLGFRQSDVRGGGAGHAALRFAFFRLGVSSAEEGAHVGAL